MMVKRFIYSVKNYFKGTPVPNYLSGKGRSL